MTRATGLAALAMVVAATVAAGDRADGESDAIQGRNQLYHQRHGRDGKVAAADLLARTRWGYAAWRESEAKLGSEPGWVSLGPVNGAGRFSCVVPHPTATGTIYGGAAGGGLWRSDDDGTTWMPLTDGLSDLSVGAVALAPSDPDVIYLGSGEGGIAGDFIPGIGLLRSPDGGASWFLPTAADEIVASQFFALAVHPGDADELLAATNRGLLRTTDGGVGWDTVIPAAGLIGVSEVVRSATDADLLYAALWCSGECPAGTDRVMRSNDAGATWEAAGAGLPPVEFNQPLFNRLALAVAASDDQILYAGIYSTVDPWYVAVYRSGDGGRSWQSTGSPGPYLGGQGWYDNTITVHPSDPQTVVAGGIGYVVTRDGGTTWTWVNPYELEGEGFGTEGIPHVDVHDLQWQGDTLWLASDGGLWRSPDAGATWSARNAGLVTRQYYGLALDPGRPQRILAGTQDNATNLRRDADDDSWDLVINSDGFDCAINQLMPEVMFGTVYFTQVYRSSDAGASWADISPTEGADLKPFYTPLTLRDDQPWVLYTGTTEVLRSSDAGSSWAPLSSFTEGGAWSSDVVTSIAVTVADPDLIMVGKGKWVYVSSDGGAVWRVTATAATVNNLAISPLDPSRAVACLAQTGDGSDQLLLSDDGGASWQASGAGLPPFAVQVARFDPRDAMVVYVGTDVGLYRSDDGGSSWAVVGQGLPAVSIHDLRLRPGSGRPVVATHGRGVWELLGDEAPNQPPTVTITAPADGAVVRLGDALAFTATAADADGEELTLTWLFADRWQTAAGGSGVGSLSSTVAHTYDRGGRTLVSAHVADARGLVATSTIAVTAVEPADSCATPRVIPGAGPFPLSVVTENASAGEETSDPAVPCMADETDVTAGRWGSLWFELTPAESARYVVSTCGSTADTVLSAWTGPACGPLTPVAGGCDDDDNYLHCTAERTDSYLELELAADTTYRFMVGAWGDAFRGRVRLNVECRSCEPASPDRLYVVPAAAHAPGVNGTTWVTDLTLYNPGTTATTATVSLEPDGAPAALLVLPSTAVEARDVVADLLGGSGTGALAVAANGDLVVTSRTFNDAAAGTYGEGIQGVAASEVVGPGGAARLIGLIESAEAGFRTNLGLVNGGAETLPVAVELYDDAGELLATLEETLPARGFVQLNRVFVRAGVAPVALGSALVHNRATGAGSLIAYASVVDELTGDPANVTSTEVVAAGGELWIPAAAHAPGVGESAWRTDLTVANLGAESAIVTVELVTSDGGAPVASFSDRLPAGSLVAYDDVVRNRLERSVTGALRLTLDRGQLVAASRTYTRDAAGGSYGQFIAGVGERAVVDPGETALLLQLRADAGFRTNLGLVNLGGQPLEVATRYFSLDGTLLATRAYSVRPRGHLQVNRALPTGAAAGAFATLASDDADARFLAYASVVDNGSDDPVYVPAVVLGE